MQRVEMIMKRGLSSLRWVLAGLDNMCTFVTFFRVLATVLDSLIQTYDFLNDLFWHLGSAFFAWRRIQQDFAKALGSMFRVSRLNGDLNPPLGGTRKK